MLVTPLAELKLLHNASFLETTSDRRKIVVASNQGDISVFDENLTNLYSYNISCSIKDLTLSPDGQTLAVKDKDARLVVFEIDGKIIFEEPETTSSKQYEHEYSCIFSTDGTLLWDVVVNIDNQVLIQHRETQSWQVLKQAILPSDCSMNYFTLTVHPQNKIISISEAAGQHGSWTYWVLNDDTTMRVTEITQLQDMAPVEFHLSGEEFLVYNDYNGKLFRYSFPDCHL